MLGGTFDPVHYGHLVAADAACAELELDQVLFVPCGRPPHKDPARTTPPEHRYLMTVLGTTSHPRFRVSRMELERPGPSFTVDTLRQLHRAYGDGTRLFFIVGADAFFDMASWRSPPDLFRLAEVVVVSRPRYNGDAVSQKIASLPVDQRRRVRHLRTASLDINASRLRRRLRAGKSVRYYVPPLVLAYIEQQGLYRDS